MVKNIVFDVGNVLTDFRWKGFLEDKGHDEAMIKRIEKATVDSPYWHEFDRGEMSDEECMQGFISEDPELEDVLRETFANVHGMVTPRDYAIPWINSLKAAGYKVFYLSNFSEKAYHECSDALEFDKYCDGGIYSYEVRLIKPEPEFYKLLCDKYSLVPEECVFFDDLERNIKAAKECGFNAFVFTDMEKANEDLRSIGVGI
ncbi:MAG: HAD family phosphatase [Lachnospiraceae bacterium]|nr:HAD family phosphatase [Lachnospiraceae bacterium]